MGPKAPKSAVPTPAEEAIVVAFVNGAAILLKSGAAKFPGLAGLGDQPRG